jgi:hypothetical protein
LTPGFEGARIARNLVETPAKRLMRYDPASATIYLI